MVRFDNNYFIYTFIESCNCGYSQLQQSFRIINEFCDVGAADVLAVTGLENTVNKGKNNE